MKFGAIDIGTNAARLLVGEVCQEGNHFYVKKISYTRVPLRLGDDVFEMGKISKEKYKNTLDTIKSFKLIAGIFNVGKLRAVATSAMRESKNADKIIIVEEGKIIQQGSHNQLVNEEGYYKALYWKQLSEKDFS